MTHTRAAKPASARLTVLVLLGIGALAFFSLLSLRDTDGDVFAPPGAVDLPVAPEHQGGSLPTAGRVARARTFAASRSGLVSFAVVDTSGKLLCYRCRTRYVSASVVKAMLLVAYLDRLAHDHRPLTPSHDALLKAMIRISDNSAASAMYAHVGDGDLYRLAAEAKMRDFDVFGNWTTAQITAADQARFFAHLDALTPASYRAYARELLSSIVHSQAWGIAKASRPQWLTFFKGGWRETTRGQLVHQVALLESGRRSLSIAVLTDGNPSQRYGRATVRGIAARLLGR